MSDERTATFEARPASCIATIETGFGSRDILTISATKYTFVVNIQHFDQDGDLTNDGAAIGLLDANTVEIYSA